MSARACSSPLHVLRDADACGVSSCRYNIAEDLDGHRCALLYAEQPRELEEIALLFHVSRQRVDQIVAGALAKKQIRALLRRADIAAEGFAHAEPPALAG